MFFSGKDCAANDENADENADPHPHSSSDPCIQSPTLELQGFSTPVFLDFDRIVVGKTKIARLAIHNPSRSKLELEIDRFSGTDQGFSILEKFPMTVMPGESVSMGVSWAPIHGSSAGANIREVLDLRVAGTRNIFRVVITGMAKESRSKSNRASKPKAASRVNADDVELPKRHSDQSWLSSGTTKPSVELETRSKSSLGIVFSRKKRKGSHDSAEKYALDPTVRTRVPKAEFANSARTVWKRRPTLNGQMIPTSPAELAFEPKVVVNAQKISVNKAKLAESQQRKLKLRLKKKAKEARPTAYRRQLVYDENWAMKQQAGFTAWLNFILLNQDDVAAKTVSSNGVVTLSQHRAEALTRQRAFVLAHSQEVEAPMFKIEEHISKGLISLRSSHQVHSDLGMRARLIELVLSYHPMWLRLALEVVFGEIISSAQPLEKCLESRLLTNPEIDAEYTYMSRGDHSYYQEGRDQALEKYTLKKLIKIILFLDVAKSASIIPSNPCLFRINARIKSTRYMMIELAKEFMQGEGDVTRHMSSLGWRYKWEQTHLEEYDFTVTNLPVDLRDGVRLAHLIDQLVGDPSPTDQLLIPATSRTRKQHNVKLALVSLMEAGISPLGCTTDDIVNGHRERTLDLLWRIVLHFRVFVLIDTEIFVREIVLNRRTLRLRVKDAPASAMLYPERHLCLLLGWANSVCVGYRTPVKNFTTSFSDGRAFCLLIHYYCPQLLALNDIRKTTIDLQRDQHKGFICTEDQVSDSAERAAPWMDFVELSAAPSQVDEALDGEVENFALLEEAVKALGCVPLQMIKRQSHQHEIPDEKVVITFLTHLATRLMVVGRESHAARRIQAAWRAHQKLVAPAKFFTKSCLIIQAVIKCTLARRHMKERDVAVFVLQAVWHASSTKRNFDSVINATTILQRAFRDLFVMRQQRAVAIIQRIVRGRFARIEALNRMKSIVTIQSTWRMRQAQRDANRRFNAVLILQAQTRGRIARIKAADRHDAIMTIQSCWRTIQACRYANNKRRAILQSQAIVRGKRARRACFQRVTAIITVQKHWRSLLDRIQAQRRQDAIITLQCRWRKAHASRQSKLRLSSIVCLQAAYRAMQVRRMASVRRLAVYAIQRHCRGFMARMQANKRRDAIIVLQSQARARYARTQSQQRRESIVMIQSFVRGARARSLAHQRRNAIIWIQRMRRKTLIEREMAERHDAIVQVQSRVRSWIVSRRALMRLNAIVRLQACYRGRCARLHANKRFNSILRLQSVYRTILAHHQMKKRLNALRTMQCILRIKVAHIDMDMTRIRVTRIQASIRRVLTVKIAMQRRHAIVVIQSTYRLYIAKNIARLRLNSIYTLQSAMRSRISTYNQHVQRSLIIGIQSMVRAKSVQKLARTRRNAIVWTQSLIRTRILRHAMKRRIDSIIAIQSAFRAFSDRTTHYHRCIAVIQTQSIVRGRQSRRFVDMKRCSIVLLQSVFRGRLERRRIAYLRCIALIQCALQTRISYLHVERYTNDIVRVQRMWRRRAHERFLFQMQIKASAWRRAQRILAKYVRIRCQRKRIEALELQICTIQLTIRAYISTRHYRRQRYSIIRIQAWLRGHWIRRKQFDNVRIRSMRQRLRTANRNWLPELSLGYRTQSALHVLHNSTKLAAVTKACRTLELVTRLLPACCVDAAEQEAVPVLFQLLQSMNRSKPHLELVKCAMRILLNMARCTESRNSIYSYGACIEVLVEEMQMNRDTPQVFVLAIELMRLGCQSSPRLLDDLRMNRDATRKLSSIHNLLRRKLETLNKFGSGGKANLAIPQLCKSVDALNSFISTYLDVNKQRPSLSLTNPQQNDESNSSRRQRSR